MKNTIKEAFIRYWKPELFVFCCLGSALLSSFLTQVLHFPSAIKYLTDACCAALLVFLIRDLKKDREARKSCLLWFVGLFFLYSFLTFVTNWQSIFYYLWGVRNLFRFYVFFFACKQYLDEKSISGLIRCLEIVFWINALLAFIEYFFFHLEQDNLGGLFGTEAGCNSALNVFFVVFFILCLVSYQYKKMSLIKAGVYFAIMLVISAMAELKFFFVESVLLLAVLPFFWKFSRKQLFLILLAVAGVMVGVGLLIWIYPNFRGAFSLRRMFASASAGSGYTGTGDYNRLNVIGKSNQLFLTTFPRKLFGLGLGNCDYAEGKAFLTTPFFIENSTCHYTWLVTAMLYLEQGFVGLAVYFGFFILSLLFLVRKCLSSSDIDEKMYLEISILTGLAMMMLAVYDSSLRNYVAFLPFAFLSFGFVKDRRGMGH